MIVYQNQNAGKSLHFWGNSHENYGMDAHLHEFTEIVYVIKGCFTAIVDRKKYEIREGEAVIILPNRIHEYVVEKENLVSGAIFSNDFVPLFFSQINNLQPESPVYKVKKRELWEEQYKNIKDQGNLKVAAFLYEACADAYENINWMKREKGREDIIQAAINFVSDNFRENISLKYMAKKLGYNEKYLSSTLHSITGLNFRRLLSSYRINYAKTLLSAEGGKISITEASERAGFSSIASFNRSFKDFEGITPSEYKKVSELQG